MSFAYGKYNHFVDPNHCEVKSYQIPPLYNLRKAGLRYNPFRNIVIRRILTRYVTERVAVSQALKAALEANGLGRFRVVYNGIDPEAFVSRTETTEQFRRRLGLLDKAVILF